MSLNQPLRVILESPFAGDVEGNIKYARAALHHSLLCGEAPIASHLLYTQEGVLDDTIPQERTLGIEAGLVWGMVAEKTVVYVDKGISKGMEYGIARAVNENRFVEFRSLPEYVSDENIDKLIEKWHTWDICDLPHQLHEFLGLTFEQYSYFVKTGNIRK